MKGLLIGSIAIPAVVAFFAAGQVHATQCDTVIFRDDFDGPNLDSDNWIINVPNSWWWVQGRTFFPSPLYHPDGPFPRVEDGACFLEHHHHNPYHLGTPKQTFLGGQIRTTMNFMPNRDYRFEARVRSPQSPGGLITSFFLYGYDGTKSDEIDFEFLSSKTNDNATYPDGDPLLTNTWNESIEKPMYRYKPPEGLDLADWNTFRIYWRPSLQRVDWSWIDPGRGEMLLRSEAVAFFVPDEPMPLYFNFWASTAAWTDAYDDDLQPAQNPDRNQIYRYEIDYVEVSAREPTLPGDTDCDGRAGVRQPGAVDPQESPALMTCSLGALLCERAPDEDPI